MFGVRVGLDLSWLLGLGLATWTFADGFLPGVAPGRSPLAYWTAGAVAALTAFLSIALHEAAHSTIGARSGLRAQRIDLSLVGGITRFAETPRSPGVALRTALAGPLASLGTALVAAAVHVAMVEADAEPVAAAVPAIVAAANLIVAAINLLPGLPLDGGHALAAVLWAVTGRREAALRAAHAVGRALGTTLALMAVLAGTAGAIALGLWAALLALVVLVPAGGR